MKDRMIVALVAICCVSLLAAVWTVMGHNHSTFSMAIGTIGTITGYTFGSLKGASP